MSNQIHTMYDPITKTWYNKQDGATRSSSTGHKTQEEAYNRAREIAKNQGLEVSTHKKQGNAIREKNSFGNDPTKSKG